MNEVPTLPTDSGSEPDIRSSTLDAIADLRATPHLIAGVVAKMRLRIRAAEQDPALSTDVRVERIGTARMWAMAQIDRLEEIALAGKATLEQAATSTASEANEIAAHWNRLHLAFTYVRHELSGRGGEQTILPGWRRGSVIRL